METEFIPLLTKWNNKQMIIEYILDNGIGEIFVLGYKVE